MARVCSSKGISACASIRPRIISSSYGEPHLIDSPVYDGPYSNDHILGHTSDIRFEDIAVYAPDGLKAPLCTFGGPKEAHCNKNVVIDGVMLNGRRLKPEEFALEKSAPCDVTIR